MGLDLAPQEGRSNAGALLERRVEVSADQKAGGQGANIVETAENSRDELAWKIEYPWLAWHVRNGRSVLFPSTLSVGRGLGRYGAHIVPVAATQ